MRLALALAFTLALLGCDGAPDAAGEESAAAAIQRELATAQRAYGEGNLPLALVHFREAARLGDANAQYYTGLMFADGQGAERNYDEAVRWYRLAAAQNHPDALFALARLHVFGLGVEADSLQAIELYERAAQAYPPGEDRERALEQARALQAVLEERQQSATAEPQ